MHQLRVGVFVQLELQVEGEGSIYYSCNFPVACAGLLSVSTYRWQWDLVTDSASRQSRRDTGLGRRTLAFQGYTVCGHCTRSHLICRNKKGYLGFQSSQPSTSFLKKTPLE